MSNWATPEATNATILDKWYFSPGLSPVSTIKQEFQNQLSNSSPRMICTANDIHSGSKLLTPLLLPHFAIPVFPQSSIELPKNALTKSINTDMYSEL